MLAQPFTSDNGATNTKVRAASLGYCDKTAYPSHTSFIILCKVIISSVTC